MKKLNGIELKKILISGINNLALNKERIDDLNVFPVPDGDTGTNMYTTMEYAINGIEKLNSSNISLIAREFSKSLLFGARGNSGVIISQIFKGFSLGLENKEQVSGLELLNSFHQAQIEAYKSVIKPTEGTILTVIKDISNNLKKKINSLHSIKFFFEQANNFARISCDETKNLLPVLKEADVIDSGSEGLCMILEGMFLALKGKPVAFNKNIIKADYADLILEQKEHNNDSFGYCTEFILNLKDKNSFKKNKFSKQLEKIGSSLVFVYDYNILKVHIHSQHPDKIFLYSQKFGDFIKMKMENMTFQAKNFSSSPQNVKPKIKNIQSKISIISCNDGEGIISYMKELGAQHIIKLEEFKKSILEKFTNIIKQISNNKIIILSNDINSLIEIKKIIKSYINKDKKIIIIPTKTQTQGIAALMNFNSDLSLKDNKISMIEAINSVKTGQIMQSDKLMKKNEYIALEDNKILKSFSTWFEAACYLSEKIIDEDTEIVTIYFGTKATKKEAQKIESFLKKNFEIETEIISGTQKKYKFLISYE